MTATKNGERVWRLKLKHSVRKGVVKDVEAYIIATEEQVKTVEAKWSSQAFLFCRKADIPFAFRHDPLYKEVSGKPLAEAIRIAEEKSNEKVAADLKARLPHRKRGERKKKEKAEKKAEKPAAEKAEKKEKATEKPAEKKAATA